MSNEAKKIKSVDLNSVAICKKNLDGTVLIQNQKCLQICGDREGQVCADNCMKEYSDKVVRPTHGTHRFNDISIADKNYDIIMLNDGEYLITLLLELSEKYKADAEFFKSLSLSPREIEIVQLMLKKTPNLKIADQLCISLATLKTHINHIYKKVPRHLLPRK